jgi:hypothetical protein
MKRLVLVLILCLLVSACRSQQPATLFPTFTPFPTRTLPPPPTATPVPPTATPEPTDTPEPTVAAIEGWERFEGGGAELWLPASYVGGDESQLDAIIETLRSLGPEFEQMAQMLEQSPSAFALWAFDSKVGDTGFLTNVNVVTERVPSDVTLETYLELFTRQLPGQFRVVAQGIVPLDTYEAARYLLEFTLQGVQGEQVMYLIKSGNTMWAVTYSTGAGEFDRRLPIFEQSIRTFKLKP